MRRSRSSGQSIRAKSRASSHHERGFDSKGGGHRTDKNGRAHSLLTQPSNGRMANSEGPRDIGQRLTLLQVLHCRPI
jgi:hypothetical protein